MNKRSERFALSYHNMIQPTPGPTKKIEICKNFALFSLYSNRAEETFANRVCTYFSESFSNLDWLQLAII